MVSGSRRSATGNLSFWVFGPAKPNENQELPDRSRTILFDELLDHFLEVWIPYAKAPREPVSAALGNFFASRYYVELASLPGVQTASMFRRCLIRVTRLATLALLFCHVGQ